MQIIGYGEDALTLWALTNRMTEILAAVKDGSSPEACSVLFRPSFGRRGGPNSSQFGEFDFILATPLGIHLGETKWQSSPEVAEPVIKLREEQTERHKVFTVYYKVWVSKPEWSWDAFLETCAEQFRQKGISKPTPPSDSLLSRNLKTSLETLAKAANRSSNVDNLLLVVDSSGTLAGKVKTPPANFLLAVIDAHGEMENGSIPLEK
jgi:hypothetical protein